VTCDVGEQVTASAQLEKNMPSHMHLVKFKTEKARLAEQKAMVLFHGKDSIDIRLFQWCVNMMTTMFRGHIHAEQQ
jgi:hypothetical protein